MSIFLDTSFLAALYNKSDQYHATAQKLGQCLITGEMGKCYTSEHIFSEVMTLLRARKFPENQIEKAGSALLNDPLITLLCMDFSQFQETWESFKKYKRLSFTDCSTVVLSDAFGIKSIASFDADFD
ncbi:MAG: PIN domain-containing protein, partial [Nanoarchaeota archaeon]